MELKETSPMWAYEHQIKLPVFSKFFKLLFQEDIYLYIYIYTNFNMETFIYKYKGGGKGELKTFDSQRYCMVVWTAHFVLVSAQVNHHHHLNY